jgi:hypothetical protein
MVSRGVARRAAYIGVLPLALCVSSGLLTAQSLEITEPKDGTVVHPGSSVTVIVTASPPESFRMVTLLMERPLKNDLILSAPPYRFTVEIPRDILVAGSYGVAASGFPAAGEPIDTDPISLDVERSDGPLRLKTQLSALHFDCVGDAGALIVYGYFADGSQVDLTHSSLTRYISGSLAIVEIDNNGLATATAPGSTSITVENNGAKVVVEVFVPPEGPPADRRE